jgi:hypothetical protein
MILDLTCRQLALAATSKVLIAGSILLLLVIIVGLRVIKYRKELFESKKPDAGLDIGEVENLHRQGLISDEEFARLRQKTLGLDAPTAPPASRPQEGDPDEETHGGQPPEKN